jgi:cyclopropane-fatty-acyl-phospholipid synthase
MACDFFRNQHLALYLAGSAHYFRTARLDLYQTFLVKTANSNSGLPLRRADWY